MSKYKLSPEEIRKNADKYAHEWGARVEPKYLASDFISFLEEATGEKVPEPFDESKVLDWSVWKSVGADRLVVVDAHVGRYTYGRYISSYGDKDQLTSALKKFGYTYLGQYNFTAGLPKEAQ
jgi:hypothetical protein